MRRSCFVTKALSWARNHKELQIVDDQIASPTWCRILAQVTAQIVSMGADNNWEKIKENKGIYNIAGKGCTSRFDWVKRVLEKDPIKRNIYTSNCLVRSHQILTRKLKVYLVSKYSLGITKSLLHLLKVMFEE